VGVERRTEVRCVRSVLASVLYWLRGHSSIMG